MKKENQHDKQNGERSHSQYAGLLLMLVQSSVTVIVLAFVFLLKMIDGRLFEPIEENFKAMMTQAVSGSENVTVVTTVTTTEKTEYAKEAVAVSATTAYEASTRQLCPPLKNGVVTSLFGSRTDPIEGTVQTEHHGVDIAAVENTELVALTNGTVSELSYEEDGYGWYVIVSCDDGHEYLYAHCSSVAVVVGEQLQAGDLVAYVGNTGRSTGSHVHIEWRFNGVPLDPMTVLPEETYA